jgi:hypothetical protein
MARRALGALVLVLALAGCGGNGGGGGGSGAAAPSNAIERAAQKTSQAGSARADLTIAGSGVSGTGSGVFNGNGDNSGQLTMDLTANGQQVNVDTVFAGNVVYLRSPALSQRLPHGKQWIKLDLARVAKQENINLNGLLDTDPTLSGTLSYLNGSTGIRKVGTETVAGVPTTHYHVTVDLERAVDRARGSDRNALRQALRASGSSTQPVDVWIDGHGYVRQIEFVTQASSTTEKLTMQLHDFGSKVPISAPSTNAVVDLLQAIGVGG